MIAGISRKIRLRPTILTLFVLLTVPVFLAIVSFTYVSNEEIAVSSADRQIGRFRTDAVGNITDMFEPIKSLVRSASVIGTQQPDFYSDNRSLKYLLSMLLHSDQLVSVYVGLADGSFRQARRMSPTVEVQDKMPPKDVKYAYRWIDPPGGAAPVDHYLFLNAEPRRDQGFRPSRRRRMIRGPGSGTARRFSRGKSTSPIPTSSPRSG